jgi:predicted MPP superfamily phosphohydrolase
LWHRDGVSLSRILGAAVGGGVAAGAALTAYGHWEARQYGLRHEVLPILPAGAQDIRLLHISDVHLVPTQRAKVDWIRMLADLGPDLVVDTGDNLAHRDSVEPLLDAFGSLLDVSGVFVNGSNDYFEPTLRNPLRYLMPDDGTRYVDGPQLPWREMTAAFRSAGWLDLNNAQGHLVVNGTRIAFTGVDDPHLEYDRLAQVAAADPAADLRIGVAHAPYVRVLDAFSVAGNDLLIAGHTHGGQVCLPGGRALTTNCDLPTEYARGLHRWNDSWLNVCAGLGTSPYTRFRIACRPEAVLLTLTAG